MFTGPAVLKERTYFLDSPPMWEYGMGGYTSGSVGHPCFLGAYIGGGLAIFEDSGPKIGFSNHGLRGPII